VRSLRQIIIAGDKGLETIARGLYLMMNVKDNPSTMAVLVDNALSPEFEYPLLALRYSMRIACSTRRRLETQPRTSSDSS
jgi:hypothetical protein